MSGLGNLRRRAFSCAPMAGLRWIPPYFPLGHAPRFDKIYPMFYAQRPCTVAAPATAAIHWLGVPNPPQSGGHARTLYRVGKQELSRPNAISGR